MSDKTSRIYEDNYPKVMKLLQKYQQQENVEYLSDEKLQQIIKGLIYLFQEYKKMPQKIQSQNPREPLFLHITTFLNISVPNELKVKILKCFLQLVLLFEVETFFSDSEWISSIEKLDILQLILKALETGFNLSKNEQNEQYLKSSSIHIPVLELLTFQKDYKGQFRLPILSNLIGILKNCSGNQSVRTLLLGDKPLSLIQSFISFEKENIPVLLSISGLLRNLVIEPDSLWRFEQVQLVEKISQMIAIFPDEYDLMLNNLRLLSKISLSESCCAIMMENPICMKHIVSFFTLYKSNTYIIIRTAFLLAYTFHLIRQQIYFELQEFQAIFDVFLFYLEALEDQPQQTGFPLKQKFSKESFGQSFAAWDYKAISKESPQDALVKVIRLMANLMTLPEIGGDFLTQKKDSYKQLLTASVYLLQKKIDKKNSELMNGILSLISNITFYEKSVFMVNDFEVSKNKQDVQFLNQILNLLPNFIVQIEYLDLLLEGLRILANYCRTKEFIKSLKQLKIIDILLVLLNHSVKEVVFYASGSLINIFHDTDLRDYYGPEALELILSILEDCQENDEDLIQNSIMVIGKLMDAKFMKNEKKRVEIILKQIQAQNLKQLILDVLNGINAQNEQLILCDFQSCFLKLDCGRSFKSLEEMQAHKKRRHSNLPFLQKMPYS